MKKYLKLFNANKQMLQAFVPIAKRAVITGEDIFLSFDHGDCKIVFEYEKKEREGVIDEIRRYFDSQFSNFIYSYDDNSLSEILFYNLKKRDMKMSVAESFTGGLVASKMIENSGVSSFFHEGIVCYSNESKMARLSVCKQTLATFGAVSEDVAFEMAQGLLLDNNCQFAIATTGIAGPNSDDTKKPVGLCYIAVGTTSGIYVHKKNLSGSREEITKFATNMALFLAIDVIKKLKD